MIVAENYYGRAGDARGAQGRRRDGRADARGDQAEPRPDDRGRPCLHPRRPVRQHRPRQFPRRGGAGSRSSSSMRSSRRPASALTWASRNSSTSSAACPACDRPLPSSSPLSVPSRCTAASVTSWPASRSTRRSRRRTRRGSSGAARTWPSTSRSCAATACPRSWRSTRFPRTSHQRSPSCKEWRWRLARQPLSSVTTSSTAVPVQRTWPGGLGSGPARRAGLPLPIPRGRDPRGAHHRIATRVYGGDGVDLSGEASKQLREFERLGHGHMPVCMAGEGDEAGRRRGAVLHHGGRKEKADRPVRTQERRRIRGHGLALRQGPGEHRPDGRMTGRNRVPEAPWSRHCGVRDPSRRRSDRRSS